MLKSHETKAAATPLSPDAQRELEHQLRRSRLTDQEVQQIAIAVIRDAEQRRAEDPLSRRRRAIAQHTPAEQRRLDDATRAYETAVEARTKAQLAAIKAEAVVRALPSSSLTATRESVALQKAEAALQTAEDAASVAGDYLASVRGQINRRIDHQTFRMLRGEK